MPDVTAYAIDSPTGSFHRTTITRRDPGPTEVAFDIAFAGICHSDIHTAREEWGPTMFPLVPGHEIAGVVTAVGEDVTGFRVGDRVGVGCLVDSCGKCPECLDGLEQFCTGPGGAVGTYNSTGRDGLPTLGGYSASITVEERFCLHIPDELTLEAAAPLLCAGITTFSPLRRWGAGPGKRVAVVGLGGLGHMAVQIAVALGAEVSVISRTMAKADDGYALGATAYYAASEPGTYKSLRNAFDLIICTVSDGVNLDALLRTLDVEGTLVIVGLPPGASQLRLGNLINRNRAVAGSNIGGIAETQEMLDFCAEKGIGAIVEVIGADEIDRAYDDVVASRVRYRYVIDTATFDRA